MTDARRTGRKKAPVNSYSLYSLQLKRVVPGFERLFLVRRRLLEDSTKTLLLRCAAHPPAPKAFIYRPHLWRHFPHYIRACGLWVLTTPWTSHGCFIMHLEDVGNVGREPGECLFLGLARRSLGGATLLQEQSQTGMSIHGHQARAGGGSVTKQFPNASIRLRGGNYGIRISKSGTRAALIDIFDEAIHSPLIALDKHAFRCAMR